MLRVQPLRWDTKVQASSIGSTSASSENPRCAMYKHCERPCDCEIFTMSGNVMVCQKPCAAYTRTLLGARLIPIRPVLEN